MLEYMLLPFRRFAEFKGRSRRKEFWAFALLQVIVYTVLIVLALSTSVSLADIAAAEGSGAFAVYRVMFSGTGLLLGVWGLVAFFPSVSVSVRRLHDRDLSGWWYLGVLIGSLIPFIGVAVSIGFLVLMCLPGTPGTNRFGSDPKLPGDREAFA